MLGINARLKLRTKNKTDLGDVGFDKLLSAAPVKYVAPHPYVFAPHDTTH